MLRIRAAKTLPGCCLQLSHLKNVHLSIGRINLSHLLCAKIGKRTFLLKIYDWGAGEKEIVAVSLSQMPPQQQYAICMRLQIRVECQLLHLE